MPVRAATGLSRRRDSFRAGREAASMALSGIQQPDLILVFASVTYAHDQVLRGVRSVTGETPVLGGSSFGEMTERGWEDGSVCLMALALEGIELSLGLGQESDRDPLRAGETAANSVLVSGQPAASCHGLGLLVAEMRANEQPLLGIQRVLGAKFPLFGGCCSGDRRAPIADPNFSQGYQFFNDQVYRHAVPLAVLSGDFSTSHAVAHGWEPLGTEVDLGRVEGNIVHEIDHEPALSFYIRHLGHAQPTAFPLGFVKDGHLVLRAARGMVDEAIVFTAPIPAGSRVRITRGGRSDILRSSEDATRRAVEELGRDRVRAALVVSCVSRRTVLGTRVVQEAEAIRRVLGEEIPLLGFYAAGEYAPPVQHSMYHNCTFCLCLIGDRIPEPEPGRLDTTPSAVHPIRVPELRRAAEPLDQDRRRVLLIVERTDLATQCREAVAGLTHEFEWRRDWDHVEDSLEPEYAQVVICEARHADRIGQLLWLNPAIQAVVLLPPRPSSAPGCAEEYASEQAACVAGSCRLPVHGSELRFLVDRALITSQLHVEKERTERELGRLRRGLHSAEDAVETSEKLLTETYRTIETANRDMRIVLDNVQQGLVTLDRAGVMAQGRSKAMDALLGEWPGPVRFCDYLARCSAPLGQLFGLAWEQVATGLLPLEVTTDLLPKQWMVGGRHLRFEYVPVQHSGSDSDCIDAMVVVVTDATAEVAKREAEAEQKEAMEVFQRIIRDPDGVDQFAADASQMVHRLTRSDQEQERDSVVIRRLLHTLKGNCGIMGLSRVAVTCHQLEDELATWRPTAGLTPAQGRRLLEAWRSVAKVIESFQSQRGDEIAIPRDAIRALSERAARGVSSQQIAAEIRTLLHEPVRKRLVRLAESARALACRLHKDPVEVVVQSEDLRLEQGKWSPLWNDLVHLIRNALDHGIKAPSEREGDQVLPQLKLEAFRQGSAFTVKVSDNGRGVDWASVAAKAAQMGLPASTTAELTAALFVDELTTRKETTDTSGRGIGLAAVRRTVERLGGVIAVTSPAGEGTTVTLRFEGVWG
ncbi:FIST N-terminal domain-containing protein [Myxococcota bacterium]